MTKAQWSATLTIVVTVVIVLVLLGVDKWMSNIPKIFPILILGIGIFLTANGYFELQSNPAVVGIITRLKKRKRRDGTLFGVLKEGPNFLFARKLINDYLGLRIFWREFKLKFTIVTPDDVDMEVEISGTFTPYTEDADLLINYLDKDPSNQPHGDKINHEAIDKEVLKGLESLFGNVLRQWARNPEYGPFTWNEAVSGKVIALNNIVKSIFGRRLLPINMAAGTEEIPTPVLIEYFHEKRPSPSNDLLRLKYGENWERLKDIIPPTSFEHSRLKVAIENRVEIIRNLESGREQDGLVNDLVIESLGILMGRINIESMSPNKENPVYKASLKQKEELEERSADDVELKTETTLARQLHDALSDDEKKDTPFMDCLNWIKDKKLIKDGKGTIYHVPGITELVKLFTKNKL